MSCLLWDLPIHRDVSLQVSKSSVGMCIMCYFIYTNELYYDFLNN